MMAKVNAYLNFNGNCEDAFNFYKSVLGGEFSSISRFGDMPSGSDSPEMPEALKNLILHISYPIGDTMLFGSDTSEEFGGKVTFGSNFSLSLTVESKEEADRIFTALSEGGQVTMPIDHTFWGSYFGSLNDKFGVQWMVDYFEAPVS